LLTYCTVGWSILCALVDHYGSIWINMDQYDRWWWWWLDYATNKSSTLSLHCTIQFYDMVDWCW
jgi:hypothetical protein